MTSKKQTFKVGSRVTVRRTNVNTMYSSEYIRGQVAEVVEGKRGTLYRVKSKDHPRGGLTVRASQLSR